jgi:hypothetical protein
MLLREAPTCAYLEGFQVLKLICWLRPFESSAGRKVTKIVAVNAATRLQQKADFRGSPSVVGPSRVGLHKARGQKTVKSRRL